MRRKIPSILALTAFEAAARHQNYSRAAAELAVTQSAVCRQIAALEDFLGVRLFRRSGRGVELTEAGAGYSRLVAARLDEVERDTVGVMARKGEGGTLELAVVPTFATKWLLPRMPAFVERHPGVQVHLTARTRPFLFDETPFDAALYAGEAGWPGTDELFLMRENLIVVSSPRRIPPGTSLRRGDWERQTLLQQSTRPYAWRHWFASRGLQVAGDMAGPRLELFSMLTEAVIGGLGLALVPRFLVEDELARGLLVQVVRHDYLSERSYYLLYPQAKAENPALVAFREWLDTQARSYRELAGLG